MSDDRQAIRELVQNWAVWRDAGDWERFATVWHDDGVMMATWFQGPAADFIRASREGFERGVRILHGYATLLASRLSARSRVWAGCRASGCDRRTPPARARTRLGSSA